MSIITYTFNSDQVKRGLNSFYIAKTIFSSSRGRRAVIIYNIAVYINCILFVAVVNAPIKNCLSSKKHFGFSGFYRRTPSHRSMPIATGLEWWTGRQSSSEYILHTIYGVSVMRKKFSLQAYSVCGGAWADRYLN